MSYEPSKDQRRSLRRERRRGTYAMFLAQVVRASGDEGHHVTVRPITKVGEEEFIGSDDKASMLVASKGDINVPSEGDLVAMANIRGSEKPVILGVLYSSESAIRQYDADERHVGDDSGGTYLHGDFAAAPRVSEDPNSPPDGAVWYRTDLDEYRGVENGTKVSFDTTAV